MRRLDFERWSRGDSFLHRRDPRAKLAVLLLFLVWLATAASLAPAVVIGYATLLIAGLAVARLPPGSVLGRAALVLPFTATFAMISLIAGDPVRAVTLAVKSFYSATAVVIIMGATPMPALLAGAETLGAPRMLIATTQFLYRYLFVLFEEAARIRLAAECRGGFRWAAAGGAVAVLFGSAYTRAEGIHRAMLARGFDGHLRSLAPRRFGWVDAALVGATGAVLGVGRMVWGL